MDAPTIIKRPSWWRERTRMERCLTVTTALCALIGLIFLIILCLHFDRNRNDSPVSKDDNMDSKLCLTAGCIRSASRVLDYLDETISPCEDFYQFACGKFLNDTYIPDEKISVDASRSKPSRFVVRPNSAVFREDDLVWLYSSSRKKGLSPSQLFQAESLKESTISCTGFTAAQKSHMKVVYLDRFRRCHEADQGDSGTLNCCWKDKSGLCVYENIQSHGQNLLEMLWNDMNTEAWADRESFFCKYRVVSYLEWNISLSSTNVISDMIEENLRKIIEEPFRPDEPRPFKMVKQLFTACMNKTLIEDQGLEDVKVTFKDLGGWPVLDGDKWREDNFDWKETIYKFRKLGYSKNYIIDLSVGVDVKNPTRRIVFLDQPDLGLDREHLIKGLEDKDVTAYYDYMVDVAVIFGADTGVALKELRESLEFEIQLANQSLPKEKRRNATALYNAMTVEELQQNYSSIPWLEYINTILAPYSQLNDTEMVIVKVPDFVSGLQDLISKTPKRAQANYLMWQAAKYSALFLNEELRKRRLLYNFVRFGQREQMSRFRECAKVVSFGLPIAVSALYVREYFAEEAKQTAKEMAEDIKKQFEDILRTVEWMDEETRANALDKAKSMISHVGYPDELLNDEKLITFYSNLELDENMYLVSIRNVNRFSVDFASKRLRQPVNKTDWITHSRSSIVNAFYNLVENSIQLPAAILQDVFFDADRPKYMNYGAIGYVIGHEITHGFDDRGRQYDREGNLFDWWQKGTKKAFDRKAQYIVDLYSNYTVNEVNLTLNGIVTQGENIADIGGLKVSYLAYDKWAKRNGEEPFLPGMKYNGRQMFWISAASIRCSKIRDESLRQIVLTGVHPPDKYRVIIPLSNLVQFGQDFHCPMGSKMNPVEKYNVW